MFCHYFAVLCSLLSAVAGFVLGRRDILRTCAQEKRGGCPLSPSHVPISLFITTNQKFKTCVCHTSHVLRLKTPIYFQSEWRHDQRRVLRVGWLRVGGWGDDQVRYLPLVFRSWVSTLLLYTDLPRAFLQTALCNSWLTLYALESRFVASNKRYWIILYLTTHVSYFK